MVSLALMKVRAKVAAKEYRSGLFSDSPPMNGLPLRFTTKTLTCEVVNTGHKRRITKVSLPRQRDARASKSHDIRKPCGVAFACNLRATKVEHRTTVHTSTNVDVGNGRARAVAMDTQDMASQDALSLPGSTTHGISPYEVVSCSYSITINATVDVGCQELQDSPRMNRMSRMNRGNTRGRHLLHSSHEEHDRVDHVWLELAIEIGLVTFFQVLLATSDRIDHASHMKRKLHGKKLQQRRGGTTCE